ncbi:hypothetical protein P9112_012202 [Eukaryota sp. TZLM1-RC]
MAQTARMSCIKEPLLKETLSLNNFGSDDRGIKLNPVSALDFKAKEKHRKCDKDIEEARAGRNTKPVLIASQFSIKGRLSVEAETFLSDF